MRFTLSPELRHLSWWLYIYIYIPLSLGNKTRVKPKNTSLRYCGKHNLVVITAISDVILDVVHGLSTCFMFFTLILTLALTVALAVALNPYLNLNDFRVVAIACMYITKGHQTRLKPRNTSLECPGTNTQVLSLRLSVT